MNELPRVSIVIPVYNGANYLKEAIESALAQTYPNCEVLVVNDGSSDGGATARIAAAFGTNIRYLEKENGGVASALNYGISHMTGEYFSWLSHDDLYLPDKIAHQMTELRSLPGDTVLYAPYIVFYPQLHLSVKADLFKKAAPEQLDDALFPVFHRMVNGCTVLFHRSHFDRAGRFDETLRTTQDYDFWFRLFRHPRVHCCPHYDVKIRMNREQGSRTVDRHAAAEDALWLSLLQRATPAEMRRVSGTVRLFYLENEISCGRHGNQEAAEHCRLMAAEALADRRRLLAGTDETPERELASMEERYEQLLGRVPKKKRFFRLFNRQNLVYLLYEIQCKGLKNGLRELSRAFSFRRSVS